jgi:hypothetical protein
MKYFTILILMTFLNSLDGQLVLKNLSYILGEWKIIDRENKKITIEKWSFENDYYKGYSYTLTDGKKTFEENMKISFKDGKAVYSVNTPGQANWIDFVQEDTAKYGEIKFENRKHDFPKYISYRQKGKFGYYAEIGDFEKIKVPFNYKSITNDSIEITKTLSLMQLKYFLGDMVGVASYYDISGRIIGGLNLIESRNQIESYWSSFKKGRWLLESAWLKINKETAVQRGKSTLSYDNSSYQDKVDFVLNWIKKEGKWYILQDIYW